MKHCFDGLPHIRGSKPWILGGVCCCTPGESLLANLHRDGLCKDLDVGALAELYQAKGIQLAMDHAGCNNLCASGPHVTRGGKCMVPPVPGTQNYQNIVTGTAMLPIRTDK